MQNVAVFWDYENCPCPSNGSGYTLVNNIRAMAQKYGAIKSLRAYTAVTEQFSTAKAAVLRSELQCSGVSLVDCPHNGRKDVADKMMIVDMLAHAIDNAPSSTVIFLISGDRDFAYAMSILRLRCYNLVLCAPNNAHTSLLAQASIFVDWASVAVLPAAWLNFSGPVNEELQPRSINQGSIPPRSGSREGNDYNTPLNGLGVVNPYMRHTVKHSDSFPSDSRGQSAEFGRTGQTCMQKAPANLMTYDSPKNSSNSADLSAQDDRMPGFNPAGCKLLHEPLISDPAGGMEGVFASSDSFPVTPDTAFQSETPLDVNASLLVIGVATSAGCATPETGISKPRISGDSSLTSYHPPVTAPLVVNESRILDSPSIQIKSAEPCHSDLPSTIDSTSDATTLLAQEVSATPEVCLFADMASSKFGAVESVTSSASAYVTATSQSAPMSSEPTRRTPLPQFKALVRILQLHRSRGVSKPNRSQVALQVSHPVYGNPYKQAGVDKWAQYAELARKEGIIELGGREAAAWVALTPKWYDADTTLM